LVWLLGYCTHWLYWLSLLYTSNAVSLSALSYSSGSDNETNINEATSNKRCKTIKAQVEGVIFKTFRVLSSALVVLFNRFKHDA
jgi:hypothetical protein